MTHFPSQPQKRNIGTKRNHITIKKQTVSNSKLGKNQAKLLKLMCDAVNAQNGGGYGIEGGRVVRLEVSQ